MPHLTLAEAFCTVYDAHQGVSVPDAVVWRRHLRPADDLIDGLRDSGTWPSETMPETTADAVRLLLAIERALVECLPMFSDESGTARGWRAQVASGYARTGTLLEDASGALLPKWQPSARTDRFEDLFLHLVRVPSRLWRNMEYSIVTGVAALMPAIDWRGAQANSVVAACLPFADELADFQICACEHQSSPAYEIRPSDRLVKGDRVMEALVSLDASSATVGVVPESCLDRGLLDRWHDAIHGTPVVSQLRWVLIGTGPTEIGNRFNEAVVLSRGRDSTGQRGRTLLKQRKRYGYTLPPDTIEQWCLTDLLPGETARNEAMVPGTAFAILETDVGRFAVLICEDLSHFEHFGPDGFGAGEIALRANVTHLLVPVFDRELKPGRWHLYAAKDWLVEATARIVVATNLAIARERARRHAQLLRSLSWFRDSLDIESVRAVPDHLVTALVIDPDYTIEADTLEAEVTRRQRSLSEAVDTIKQQLRRSLHGLTEPEDRRLAEHLVEHPYALRDLLEDRYMWFDGPPSSRCVQARHATDAAILEMAELQP